MRLVNWVDVDGWKRRSLVKDDDGDDVAPNGIPQDVPDVNAIDWDGVKRDLHNVMFDRGLFDYSDIIKQQNSVSSAINSALRTRLIALYKQRRVRQR